MQTQNLPIQVSGASANAAPQRANASQAGDSAQFSRALSREMEQHQNRPAPAAAKPQAAPPQQSQAPQAPVQAQAKPAEGKSATENASASTDEARDDAADAAAASPVADMLALVASFNQPAAALPPSTVAGQATDLAGHAGIPASADADTAALATAAKAQAALDGTARAAMKGVAGARDAEPKLADAHAPKSILGATSTDNSTALAGAAQARDTDSAAAAGGKVGAKAEAPLAPAAPQVETASLRARETVVDAATLKDAPLAAPLMAPVQQASAAMAQAVTGTPADRIAARVGTPGWDNQVGQKIIWMVAGNEQSASLTLNPPDMGPMQVVLNVTNDQATVTFTAAQPEVRQALEDAMPKLREMMSESGIALGNATVNAGTQDQRQAQQGEQSRGQGAGGRFGGRGADTAPIAVTPRQGRSEGGTGLVDTFA